MAKTSENAALDMSMEPQAQPEPSAVDKVDLTINLPVLSQPQAALEVVQENLQGFQDDIKLFEKINMPSGGGLSFEITDENGEPQPIQKLQGVILHKQPFKAWYEKSFEEKSDDDLGIPDCYATQANVNGVARFVGSGCERAGIPKGQACESCPKNQWGSDRRGGNGKDCADKIRIHILREGNVFPDYLDLPPTSTGNFKDYLKRLSNKLFTFYGVITAVGLEKAESTKGKIKYSKATFAKAGELAPQERKAIQGYIGKLRPAMEQISRESIGEPVSFAGNTNDGDGQDINNMDFSDDKATGKAEQVY